MWETMMRTNIDKSDHLIKAIMNKTLQFWVTTTKLQREFEDKYGEDEGE